MNDDVEGEVIDLDSRRALPHPPTQDPRVSKTGVFVYRRPPHPCAVGTLTDKPKPTTEDVDPYESDRLDRETAKRISRDRRAKGKPSLTSIRADFDKAIRAVEEAKNEAVRLRWTLAAAEEEVELTTPEETLEVAARIVYPHGRHGRSFDLRAHYAARGAISSKQAFHLLLVLAKIGVEVHAHAMPPIYRVEGLTPAQEECLVPYYRKTAKVR